MGPSKKTKGATSCLKIKAAKKARNPNSQRPPRVAEPRVFYTEPYRLRKGAVRLCHAARILKFCTRKVIIIKTGGKFYGS